MHLHVNYKKLLVIDPFLRKTSVTVKFKVHAAKNVHSAVVERKVVRIVESEIADIALLQTEKPIKYDHRYIAPICLPPKTNHSFEAKSCLVTGFADDDNENGTEFF